VPVIQVGEVVLDSAEPVLEGVDFVGEVLRLERVEIIHGCAHRDLVS
jgi:hypothetical protein